MNNMDLFKDWFNNLLKIAPHPSLKEDGFKAACACDTIINVSDLFDFKVDQSLRRIRSNLQTFWFPLGESFGFPLECIYGAMAVLRNAEKHKKRVLLHCIAGRNRSVAVADCYFFMRTGEHRHDNSFDITYGKNRSNQLLLNVQDNQLPGIFRTEEFLFKCRELLDNSKVACDAPVDWLFKESIYY